MEEVTLEGAEATKRGLDPANKDVGVVQLAGSKLCTDMLEIRERKMNVMRRQMLSMDKFTMYEKQKEAAESQVFDIRRALLRAKKEKDAAVTGTVLRQRANARELAEMSKRKDEMETKLAGIAEYFNGSREELDNANKSVQRVTVVMEQKEAELRLLKAKVETMLDQRTTTVLLCREKEAYSLTRKKTVARDLQTASVRLDAVVKEAARAAKWTEALIDSSVYQNGILQRLRTKDLRAYLARETDSLKASILEAQEEIADIEGILVELGNVVDKASGEASELRQVKGGGGRGEGGGGSDGPEPRTRNPYPHSPPPHP